MLEVLLYTLYAIGGMLGVISFAYLIARVSSIAHYRTRAEYDRSHREPFNGEPNGRED